LRLLIALSLIHLQSGELHALHQSAERLLTLSAPRGMDLCITWAHYFLGRVAYEWNDLGGAAEHFFAVTAMRGRCHMAMVREATFDLALTYQAQGRSAKALLGELEEFLAATDDGESMLLLNSFRARLALACGARPLPLVPQVAADPRRRWLCSIENSQLTAIRSMLAHGGANEPAAMSLLTNFLVRAERECVVQLQVEALAVQALTQQDRGLEGAALDSLARALVLAEPGGFIRTFIDLGAPLAALLRRLETCRGSSAHVRALLATMPVPPAELPASPPSPAIPARADSRAATIPSHDAIGDLIEQLTNRELQVLACLDHHLTSKEIAIELSISPLTVKRHISNLSGKLGVSSRRLAVRRARVFGLLPVPVLR
jgi:LuxR family maltose regulon positive regulatory protein